MLTRAPVKILQNKYSNEYFEGGLTLSSDIIDGMMGRRIIREDFKQHKVKKF